MTPRQDEMAKLMTESQTQTEEQTEEQTYTLEQAAVAVLENATQEGRCPHCGRRNDSEEAHLFQTLRDESAAARSERDDALAETKRLQDSNAMYEGEVENLRRRLAETG